MKKRFPVLDAWRSLAVVLMLVYHFLYDLYTFDVITRWEIFCAPWNIIQQFTCSSFILLAGASARFSRNNLRHGITVLAAGVVVEVGAALAGQTIRFGVLMLLGWSMVLWHYLEKRLRKLPPAVLGWGSFVLFFATRAMTLGRRAPVGWLYPLGFISSGFHSADYFPLLPWFFMFLLGTILGGWCLENRENPLLTAPLPAAVTWLGRHSLFVYILHQPVLYGICYLIWG